MKKEGKLEMIASITLEEYDDLYKVVDFLNRTLKHKQVLFGLKKIKNENQMVLSIYQV